MDIITLTVHRLLNNGVVLKLKRGDIIREKTP